MDLETLLNAAYLMHLARVACFHALLNGTLCSLKPSVTAVQIPEYCRVLEEGEISEHCFDLIFAFDEIVALGYRENVNLAQIRTFTEMDSHEEKVFRAVREVRESARRKATL